MSLAKARITQMRTIIEINWVVIINNITDYNDSDVIKSVKKMKY